MSKATTLLIHLERGYGVKSEAYMLSAILPFVSSAPMFDMEAKKPDTKNDPRLKQLKIKTGVVRRLAKEKVMYEQEADSQRIRVQKYKDEGRDEHDVRKQEEVLQESLMMVPDCQRRLLKAFEDLQKTLDEVVELKGTEDYSAAVKVLDVAKTELPPAGQALQHFC